MSKEKEFGILLNNPADRKAIADAAGEAAGFLLLIDKNKEMIKEIAEDINDKFGISPANFNKLSKLYHKQNKEEEEAKIEAQFDLYDQVFGKATPVPEIQLNG